jgi:squalene-hopene/tetraprenyl-beta-curcumene cyclase
MFGNTSKGRKEEMERIKKLLGTMLVLIIAVSSLNYIAGIKTVSASTPSLYTQKWYSFSDGETVYDVYVASTIELPNLYGRPLSKDTDAPNIVRIYVEQDGVPVEDLGKIMEVTLSAQSCARFVQSITSDDIKRPINTMDYHVLLRVDDKGNYYNVSASTFVQDWYENYILNGVEVAGYPIIPGLDNYDYRVSIYQQVFLKLVLQEELYDKMDNFREYVETLETILTTAGIPSDIIDFILSSYATVKRIEPEKMEKIFMKNVDEVLKNLEKILKEQKKLSVSIKWLRKHLKELNKVAQVIEAAGVALDVFNDALRLKLLGTIANAYADQRLEAIKWWIDNFNQFVNDPAINEAFEKANETIQTLYKKYYESIIYCIKDAIDLDKVINIGFFLLKLKASLAILPWQLSYELCKWMWDVTHLMAQDFLEATLHKKLCDTLIAEKEKLASTDPKPFIEVNKILELFQMNYYLGFAYYKDYLQAIDNPLTKVQAALYDWAKNMLSYCNTRKDENMRNARELTLPTSLAGWKWHDWDDLWITQKAGLKLNFHITVEPEKIFYKPGETAKVVVYVNNLMGEKKQYWLGVSFQDPYGESSKYDEMISITPQYADLNAGDSMIHTVQWTIPNDAPLGMYHVTVNCWTDNTYSKKYEDDLDVWEPIFYIYKLVILAPKNDRPALAGNPTSPRSIRVEVFIPIPFLPTTAFDISIGNRKATFVKTTTLALPIDYFPVNLLFLEFLGFYAFDVDTPVQDTEGAYNLTVSVKYDTINDVAEERGAILYTIADEVGKGLTWLRTRQYGDGSWRSNVGVTALCALAFLNAGYDENDPTVRKAINYILSNVKPNGAIYESSNLQTYETSLAILSLVATHNNTYINIIENAKNWLIKCQWDEGEGITPDDWRYGGFGYYISYRPDLSNTQFAALALEAAGLPKDNPSWSKLQVFLHRCQKVNFPINVTIDGSVYTVKPWNYAGTTGGYDGGFVYLPGDNPYYSGGESSMGAMTGAGIWCLLLAGVSRTDQRITEAINWVINHYTWDTNPNSAGYRRYYYYLTVAKALTMYGEKIIGGHDWYQELSNKITSEIIALGDDKAYWNPSQEDFVPELPTAYAILSLQTRVTAPTIQRFSYLTLILRSNCLIRIISPEGKAVGYNYLNGRGENQIPTAIYSGPFMEPQYIVIVNPQAGTYRLELVGISEGSYELTIQGNYGEEVTDTFTYQGEIKPAELHAADITVTAIVGPIDIYANPPEPKGIVDKIPPITTLIIGEPKYVDDEDNMHTIQSVPFTLSAEDNPGGIGVALTAYKIYNTTYDSGWLIYVGPFNLSSFRGRYFIAYNSTDNAGNIEETHIITVIVLLGDINFDGFVDYRDLAILISCYASRLNEAGYKVEADLNIDGVIDYKDLAILLNYYGEKA